MSEVTAAERKEALKKLLDASFPDLRCLRCGHDRFTVRLEHASSPLDELDPLHVADEMISSAFGETITLICDRCGKIESHLRAFLEAAEKPVVGAGSD